MLRRKSALLLVSLAGLLGLLALPAPGASGDGNGAPSVGQSQGNGPSQPRCDPQPDKGNGPPAGKGTKKCASQ